MKSWMRIIIAVLVLVGGSVFFRQWSLSQFNNALDNLSASYVASTPQIYSSGTDEEQISTTTSDISRVVATSTNSELVETFATSTKPKLSITFPQKNGEIYIGCTYSISWQSSTTIGSLGLSLVDAGTREVAGPIASGLSKENTIEKDSQNLKWKVGVIWPGEYYIKISNVNGQEITERSGVFTINKMPGGVKAEEQENICKKSGGSF